MRPWLLSILVALSLPIAGRADRLDDIVREQMRRRNIPGLSLAIIEGGKVVRAQGYGFADREGKTPVTPASLFQAGSISKSVAALGAMHLVDRGRLSLDEDVNLKLRSWKVPDSEHTRDQKVTLRRLLSHSAGFNVHGFSGYPAGSTLPSLVQVLKGEPGVRSAAVHVEYAPGTGWSYSGGGYCVMQQLMVDVSGKSFSDLMRDSVLKPLGMSSSTFEQPLPAALVSAAATGYHLGGKPVAGRWALHPEMAAAGLWTTPADLARFAIGIQDAFAGKPSGIVSQATAREMLKPQAGLDALGVFMSGSGRSIRFGHDGRNQGFDSSLVAYAEAGQGAVVMINYNPESSRGVQRIMDAIARQYRWPDYPAFREEKAIEDRELAVTTQLRSVLTDLEAGKIDEAVYTPQMAGFLRQGLPAVIEEARRLGPVRSLELLERPPVGGSRAYRYRVVHQQDTFLYTLTLDKSGKIASLWGEAD